MAIERTPLSAAELSATAQKAVVSGPTRMMAARGLLPMAPADQAAVLYQLSCDADTAVAAAARTTATGLPEKLLVGVLAGRLDPRILDFFSSLHGDKHAVLEAVILNASTADATIAHHSKSFSLAAKILPPACRDDAAVVYSYCRRVDDAVDEVAAEAALPAIARLRQELATLYQAAAEPAATPIADPVLARFAAICESRRIPRHYPAELIAGMEMDAVGARYERLEDLLRYAYRVAGVVGLMMCHVMSLRGERALVHAAHLGIAMQLTNICRDVAEDWRRGRLYLPAELLARHGAKDLAAQARDGRARVGCLLYTSDAADE